jgi:3-oxoacyl-[acyl-carrier-protein] synthase III
MGLQYVVTSKNEEHNAMSDGEKVEIINSPTISFFDRPNVQKTSIPVAGGIPFGVESVYNAELGIGGAYGAWGASYDNEHLPEFVGQHLGKPLDETEVMNLSELGFVSRHHSPDLSADEHRELELEVGERLLRQALDANGWKPSEIEGLLIGVTAPVANDYVVQLAKRVGIPESALKVSVHKACDGAMGALHLALNPDLSPSGYVNIAEHLRGKKVLVGGIEGLSRLVSQAHDKHALQLFGNGGAVTGVIPGETMKFLVGRSHENYDEEGMLKVRMYYPHSGERTPGKPLLEVSQAGPEHIRFAGLMHEPEDGEAIEMAGLMGMVKLFVRTGVQVASDVFQDYQALMSKLGDSSKSIKVAVIHHANYKINLLISKQLSKGGINLPMPWVLSDFGNISAASAMIAFLRQLKDINPGDHVLLDGFGAGTYYDVLAVAFG